MEIVDALKLMLNHVETGIPDKHPALDQARIAIAWDITGYAMTNLMERLVREGYVREDREKELLERTANMREHHAFQTNEELKHDQEKQEIEDMLSCD